MLELIDDNSANIVTMSFQLIMKNSEKCRWCDDSMTEVFYSRCKELKRHSFSHYAWQCSCHHVGFVFVFSSQNVQICCLQFVLTLTRLVAIEPVTLTEYIQKQLKFAQYRRYESSLFTTSASFLLHLSIVTLYCYLDTLQCTNYDL